MIKKVITPDDGREYFFGYYDLQPFDASGKKHLTHRVAFRNRLPNADDIAELGYIEVKTEKFIKLAETRAWNFQQGALLQWFDGGNKIIFNDFDGEKYVSRVVDEHGAEVERFPLPFASLSPDRRYGLSVNFSRIYDFRSGYGYCNLKDPFFDERAPEDDGVVLYDLLKRERRLLLSYAQMKKRFDEEPFSSEKLVVNHINFDPTGKKYVMLLRNMSGRWRTLLAVGDIDGNVKALTKFEVNSHYSWRDERTLMIYAGLPDWGIYIFDVISGKKYRLNEPMLDKDDIHCNYSPDGSAMIGDGYPDQDGKRHIFYYDFAEKKVADLLAVRSESTADINLRCDLHARWNRDGTAISYDTTEYGKRQIAVIKDL